MILAGDIGGTKVNLAWFSVTGKGLHLVRKQTFPSGEFSDFDRLLEAFLSTGPSPLIDRVCLGVAGPILDGRCRVTYLPWVLEEAHLKKRLNTERVSLINDLAATASGIPHMRPDQFLEIQAGVPIPMGRIGVISAGTGLGQGCLLPDPEGNFLIVESEGGQADFPTRTRLETEFLHYLLDDLDRVKVEHVVSGPGLVRLYRFLRSRTASEGDTSSPGMSDSETAATIVQAGLENRDPVCRQTLEVFVSAYGAIAGNVALQWVTRGGIYLGGGIAPKILAQLPPDIFLEAFRAKGEFREFMETLPVNVITDEDLPLWGAAHFALGEKLKRW